MYYPKSQITPNLYTNGNEFVLSTTQEVYSGFYYKTSTGKFYTGRNQDDRPNIELLPLITPQTISTPTQENFQRNYITTTSIYDANNETYLNITSQQPISKFIPTYLPEIPTQQDYQIGEFRRYFCKKTNEIIYIEINQEQFDQLVAKDPQIEFSIYFPFDLTWQLTGDKQTVARINKSSIELITRQQRLPKLDQYLRLDYTKYFLFPNISNLYTPGGEFKTADGKNYIGFYHIHDKTGPMVGKVHPKVPHPLLFPINENIILNITTQYNIPSVTRNTGSYTPPPMNRGGGGGSGGGSGGGGSGGGGGY